MRIVAPRAPLGFWIAACVVSVLPDADSALHFAGVPYEHHFGHRGFSHSLLFAAAAAAAATLVQRGRRRWMGLFFFCVTASHGLLDAMTDGGLGVAFLFPDNTRYFMPTQPIVVGPIYPSDFFSEWGVAVIRSELLVVWLPLSILLGIVEAARSCRIRA